MKLFKSKRLQADAGTPDPSSSTGNPYLNARREWNSHVGGVVASRRLWQLVGVLALLIVLASVGGLTTVAMQSKFVPYVVVQDNLGKLGTPIVLDRAGPVDPRVIERTVREFIEDARLVTPDIALQRKAIFRVYAHLAPNVPAIVKMNEWMNSTPQSSPFKRAASETVNTEVISALPQSPTTWQIDWAETTRDLNGAMKAPPVRMRALVTVYTAPASAKTTAEQLRDNPLLIYVRDFSWSKQL
ncbi:VirB8/TrbF family protein [Variovorax sp. CAN2819]|uniref:VirB8/TrbF family protein n=1 Tax=Variovorax sp. CAN15 TaxID=3046727 RepID=UPI0026494CB8|nr:VirB8/TrbF family protein [Variovorax sp. CAN15]MDN6888376.1 VirB8/TrbF family protein [Variovorax sp. CAN15]